MRILISAFLIALYMQAQAQNTDISELPTAIFASAIPALPDSSNLPTELIIEVDPAQFIDDVGGQLLPESEKKKILLLKFLEYSKTTVPPKLTKLFDKLGIPEDVKKFIIDDYIASRLNAAPEALARSKANGPIARVYSVAGLGLSDFLMNSLKKKSWGQWLPARASFGFSLGFGTAVLFFKHEGKRKIMIRLFSSVEKSDKIINWLSEAMALVSIGRASDELLDYYENPKIFGFEKKSYTRSMLNLAGNTITEKNYFEYNIDGAIGPFFPGGFYELKGEYRGVYFVISRDMLKDLKQSVIKSCQRFFRPAK